MLQSGRIAPAPQTGDVDFDFMFADARPRSDLLHSFEALRSRRSTPYNVYADARHGQLLGPLALPSGGAVEPAQRKWRVGGTSDSNVPSLLAFPNHLPGSQNIQTAEATGLQDRGPAVSGRSAAGQLGAGPLNQPLSNRSGRRALNYNASGVGSGTGNPVGAAVARTGKVALNNQAHSSSVAPVPEAHHPASAAQLSAVREPETMGPGGRGGGAREMARNILQSRAGAVGQGSARRSSIIEPPTELNQHSPTPLPGQQPQPRIQAQQQPPQQQQQPRQRQRWQMPGRQSDLRGTLSRPAGAAGTGGGAGTLPRKPAQAGAPGGGSLQRSSSSLPGRQRWPPPPQRTSVQPQRAQQKHHGPAPQQQRAQQTRQGARHGVGAAGTGAAGSPGQWAAPMTNATVAATPESTAAAVDVSGPASTRRQKLEALKARRARSLPGAPLEPGSEPSIVSDLVSMVGYAEQVAAVDPIWARSASSPSPGRGPHGQGGTARSPHHGASFYDSPTRVASGGAQRTPLVVRSPEKGTHADPGDLGGGGGPLRQEQWQAAPTARPSGPIGKFPGVRVGDVDDTRDPSDQRQTDSLRTHTRTQYTAGMEADCGEADPRGLERRNQRDQGLPSRPNEGEGESSPRQRDGGDSSGRRIRMAEMVRRFREEPVLVALEGEAADGAEEEEGGRRLNDEYGSPDGANGSKNHLVDHLAAAVLQRSRAMLRERDVIQQRIEAALAKFGTGLGQQRSPRSHPPPSVSPAGATEPGGPRADWRDVVASGVKEVLPAEAEADGEVSAPGGMAARPRSAGRAGLRGLSTADSSGSEGALDVTSAAAGISPGRERAPTASAGGDSSGSRGSAVGGSATVAAARRTVATEDLGMAGDTSAACVDRTTARGRSAAPERQAPWRERLKALLAQAGVDSEPISSLDGAAAVGEASGGGPPVLALMSPAAAASAADRLPNDPLQAWRQLRQQQKWSPGAPLQPAATAALAGGSTSAACSSLVEAASTDGQDLVRRFNGTLGAHLPMGFSAVRSALADWLGHVSDAAAGRRFGNGADGVAASGLAPTTAFATAAADVEASSPSVDELLARLAQRFGLAPGTAPPALLPSHRVTSGGVATAVGAGAPMAAAGLAGGSAVTSATASGVAPFEALSTAEGRAPSSAVFSTNGHAGVGVAGTAVMPSLGTGVVSNSRQAAGQHGELAAPSQSRSGLTAPSQESCAQPELQDAPGAAMDVAAAAVPQLLALSRTGQVWDAGRQLVDAIEDDAAGTESSSGATVHAGQATGTAPTHGSQPQAHPAARARGLAVPELGPDHTSEASLDGPLASAVASSRTEAGDEDAEAIEEERGKGFADSAASAASEDEDGDAPVVAAVGWPGWLAALGVPRPVDPALLPGLFRSDDNDDDDGNGASCGEDDRIGLSERPEEGGAQGPAVGEYGASGGARGSAVDEEAEEAEDGLPQVVRTVETLARPDPVAVSQYPASHSAREGDGNGSSLAHSGVGTQDVALRAALTMTASPLTPSGSATLLHTGAGPAVVEIEAVFSTPITQRPGRLRGGGEQSSPAANPRLAAAWEAGPRPVSFTPFLGSLLDHAVGGSLFTDSPPPSTIKASARRQPEEVEVRGSGDMLCNDSGSVGGDEDGGNDDAYIEGEAFWPIASMEPVAELNPSRRRRLARGNLRLPESQGAEGTGASSGDVSNPSGLALRVSGDMSRSLTSSGGTRVAAILQQTVTAALFGDSPATSLDVDRGGSGVFNRGVSGSGDASAARLERSGFVSATGDAEKDLSRSAARLSPLGERSASALAAEDPGAGAFEGVRAAASPLPTAELESAASGSYGGSAWESQRQTAPPLQEDSAASIDPRWGVADVPVTLHQEHLVTLHQEQLGDYAPSGRRMLGASAHGAAAGSDSAGDVISRGAGGVSGGGSEMGVDRQGSGGSTLFSEVYEEDFADPSPQSSSSAASLPALAAAAPALVPLLAAVDSGSPGTGRPASGALGPLRQQQLWDGQQAQQGGQGAAPAAALPAADASEERSGFGYVGLSAPGTGPLGAKVPARRYKAAAGAAATDYSAMDLSGDVLLGVSGLDGDSSGSASPEPSGGEAAPGSPTSVDLPSGGLEPDARAPGQGVRPHPAQVLRHHLGMEVANWTGNENDSVGVTYIDPRPTAAAGSLSAAVSEPSAPSVQGDGADGADACTWAASQVRIRQEASAVEAGSTDGAAAAAPTAGLFAGAGSSPGRSLPGSSSGSLTAAAAPVTAAWGPGAVGGSRATGAAVESADEEGSRTTDVPSSRGLEADRSASFTESVSTTGVPVQPLLYSLDIEELLMMGAMAGGESARSSGAAAAAAAAAATLAAAAAAAGMSFPEAAAAAAASGSFDIAVDPVTGESGLVFVMDDPLDVLLLSNSGGLGSSGGVPLARRVPPVVIKEIGTSEEESTSVAASAAASAAGSAAPTPAAATEPGRPGPDAWRPQHQRQRWDTAGSVSQREPFGTSPEPFPASGAASERGMEKESAAGPSNPVAPAGAAKSEDGTRAHPSGAPRLFGDAQSDSRNRVWAVKAAAAVAMPHGCDAATATAAALTPTYSSDTVAYAPGDHAAAVAAGEAGHIGRISSSSEEADARGRFVGAGAASPFEGTAPSAPAAPARVSAISGSESGVTGGTGRTGADGAGVTLDGNPPYCGTGATGTGTSCAGGQVPGSDEAAPISPLTCAPLPAAPLLGGTGGGSPHAAPRRLLPVGSPSSGSSHGSFSIRGPQQQYEQHWALHQAQQPCRSGGAARQGEPFPAPGQLTGARARTRRSLFVESEVSFGHDEDMGLSPEPLQGHTAAAATAADAAYSSSLDDNGCSGEPSAGVIPLTTGLRSTGAVNDAWGDSTAGPPAAIAAVTSQSGSAWQPRGSPSTESPAGCQPSVSLQTGWQVGATATTGPAAELERRKLPTMQPPQPVMGPVLAGTSLQAPDSQPPLVRRLHVEQHAHLPSARPAARHLQGMSVQQQDQPGAWTASTAHAGHVSATRRPGSTTTTFTSAAQQTLAHSMQAQPPQANSFGGAGTRTAAIGCWAETVSTDCVQPPPLAQLAPLPQAQAVLPQQQWAPPLHTAAAPLEHGSLLGSRALCSALPYAYATPSTNAHVNPLQRGPAAAQPWPGGTTSSAVAAEAAWPPSVPLGSSAGAAAEDEDVVVAMLKRKMDACMDKLRSLERNLHSPPTSVAR